MNRKSIGKLTMSDLEKLENAEVEKIKNAYVATVIFYFRHGDSLNVARNKASEESTVQKTVIHKLCINDPRLKKLSLETKRKINEVNKKFYSGVKMSDELLIIYKENEKLLMNYNKKIGESKWSKN